MVVADSAITLTLEEVLARVTPDVGVAGEVLNGTAADDALTGGAGDDYLTGGAGADTLSGGDGNDVFGDILADDAVDTMTGGAGRDTYRYLPIHDLPANFVEDVVTDFQAGNGGDVIRLSSSNPNPFENGLLRISQVGDDTIILLRNSEGFDRSVLRLIGVTAADLTAENFGGLPFDLDNSVNINDGAAGGMDSSL